MDFEDLVTHKDKLCRRGTSNNQKDLSQSCNPKLVPTSNLSLNAGLHRCDKWFIIHIIITLAIYKPLKVCALPTICFCAFKSLGFPASPHISAHGDQLESHDFQPSTSFSCSYYFHNCQHCSGICNVINTRHWCIIHLMLFICWQIAWCC